MATELDAGYFRASFPKPDRVGRVLPLLVTWRQGHARSETKTSHIARQGT